MKNIESRFVKTHLCGVLVHEISLYADVWIYAHHKHDSNQVITLVMNIICDVKRKKGSLPPTLRIQADDITRENKNVYMFAMCAALVGLGFSKEIHLCFLIMGHTHEDIDQKFSIISNVLKRKDIDTLDEMLQLVEKGTSYMEAFVKARKLEHIHNWKTFITPHLLRGGDHLTGITLPHHMRFYMDSGSVRVQYKHFYSDEWGPTSGYLCLNSLPSVAEKSGLAEVYPVDKRELKASDEFVAYKEKLALRGVNPIRNVEVAEEIKISQDYLETFPHRNREAHHELPFWPNEVQNRNGDGDTVQNPEGTETISSAIADANENIAESAAVDLIMVTMPNPERRGYFGPRRDRPPQEASRRVTGRRNTHGCSDVLPIVVQDAGEDPFPAFNPENDVVVGQFVALTVELEEVRRGVPFYIGKVLEFGQGRWASKMKVLWYWPTMRLGAQDEADSNRVRYTNCMEATWGPSGERFSWIDKEATI